MRDLIFKNIKIKIVTVLVAIFIWFFVESENYYKYVIEIPIHVTNLAADKIIVNDIPTHVKVVLWGKGRDLLSLMLNQNLKYNLVLSNKNNNEIYKLNKKNVRFARARNIEILQILSPHSISVKIENLEEKKVPIKPNIEVITLPGYTVVNGIQLDSSFIEIAGAKSGLDSVQFVETEKLIFKNIKRDIYKKVKLITPHIKNVWLKQNEMHFFVDVQKLLEKPLVEIPIQVINKPNNVELTVIPSSLSLTIIGGVDLILPLTNKDITAYIDYQKVKDSKEKYYLAYIDKPEGVRIKDVKPKYFRIIVKRK